ncbi:NfeD family protein [Paenibacillus sp. GCM10023248]|uniref:NfeD family protein n=1 Tax=Bacillales TaxID=1385 RepID=UPI00237871D7|nr:MULTISPECIES: NfeD family protein [Bacillales]MDD9271028.1 NfeD family protein [Paenibacillus sp. MAHUQ-63]MDR6882835.1 membrane-bound ClpP family serine protease [Bacillus sp. 3255]
MMTLFAICFFTGLVLTVLLTFFGGDFFEFHGDAGGGHGHGHGGPSFFNLSSLLASLTAFGGIGYMLGELGMTNALVILLIAIGSGLVMGWLFFLFYVKVIYKHDNSMKESDFELSGQLGRLIVGINGHGIGEMVIVMQGTKRSISARSAEGESIPKGAKVVILHMDKGVATVSRFSDLA